MTESQMPVDIVPGEQPACSTPNKDSQVPSAYEENMIWVQCDELTCLKWRLIPKFTEGVAVKLDLESSWFCCMHPDPAYSSCSVPQDKIPKDSTLRKRGLTYAYSLLPVGTLVLAKASRWPWWPAILSPDPDSDEYMTLDSEGDVASYHVEFLGKPRSRYWVSGRLVTKYRPITMEDYKAVKGHIPRKAFDFAIKEAAIFSGMECEERLQACHFKPQDLLSQAQHLMKELQMMMKQPTGFSNRTWHPKERQMCKDGAEDSVEMVTIEEFMFASARTREEIWTLAPDSGGWHK